MPVFMPHTLQSDGFVLLFPQKHSVNEQIKLVQPVHLTRDLSPRFLRPTYFSAHDGFKYLTALLFKDTYTVETEKMHCNKILMHLGETWDKHSFQRLHNLSLSSPRFPKPGLINKTALKPRGMLIR